jgi:hypothetical protein
MKQADLICDAIEQCQKEGITICRGPIFDWCGSDLIKPTQCSAEGAVLYVNGEANGPSKVRALYRLLDVDQWWLYMFHIGYHNNYQIMVIGQDDKPIRPDETCKLGISIAKKYVPKLIQKTLPLP